jgi:hypothetical protein
MRWVQCFPVVRLGFILETRAGVSALAVEVADLVVAGFAGRDGAAIEHHIEELAAIGVPRPSAVPQFYRVAANQLVQADRVQVVGSSSSGEVEPAVIAVGGELVVTVASDHTDRALERTSVALSKQLCVKPIAATAWPLEEVAGHWDELEVRAAIVEDGRAVVYQHAPLAALRTPADLIARYTGGGALADGTVMLGGTVAVRGSIRPAAAFAMELIDPRLGRTIRHRYAIDVLAEVA